MTRRQRAEARLNKYFSRFICIRDGFTCFTCFTCGHLITRGRMATKYLEENANAQCDPCNSRHEYVPAIYRDKWIAEHSEEAYAELERKSRRPGKISTQVLEEMADHYREKVKALEAEFGECG